MEKRPSHALFGLILIISSVIMILIAVVVNSSPGATIGFVIVGILILVMGFALWRGGTVDPKAKDQNENDQEK
jgi:uncharacterized membrane protein HdeD (DUF308 family)